MKRLLLVVDEAVADAEPLVRTTPDRLTPSSWIAPAESLRTRRHVSGA